MTASMQALDTVTGARQELTVVLPVRLRRTPDWEEGPFPFELGSRRTDAVTRSTYFAPASARVLYGAPGRPRRWYRPLEVEHDGLRLLGMELLRTATARNPDHALAVLHLSVDRPLLPVLRAIATRGPAAALPAPLSGPLTPSELLAGIAEVRDGDGPFAIARPYTVAFMTPGPEHTPVHRLGTEGELPAGARPLAVAAGVPIEPGRLPPGPRDGPRATRRCRPDLGRLECTRPASGSRVPRPPFRHRAGRLLRIRRPALAHGLPGRTAARLAAA